MKAFTTLVALLSVSLVSAYPSAPTHEVHERDVEASERAIPMETFIGSLQITMPNNDTEFFVSDTIDDFVFYSLQDVGNNGGDLLFVSFKAFASGKTHNISLFPLNSGVDFPANYPFIGLAISTTENTGNQADLVQGSSNFAFWTGGDRLLDPGAAQDFPTLYSDTTNIPAPYQTANFVFDADTQEFTIEWYLEDGTVVPVQLCQFNAPGADSFLFVTGDVAAVAKKFPADVVKGAYKMNLSNV